MTMDINQNFTWIPFYEEMARKLLDYRNNRKALVDIVYGLGNKMVGYIKATKQGGRVDDIDPFSVYGIFNRGKLKNEKRLDIVKYFKDKFHISAELPKDFASVPVLNMMSATFYWRENISTDIQPLWDLFECVMLNRTDNFISCFNRVIGQQGVKWNITMGLYWMRPNEYIALDSRNREYLPQIGIDVFNETELDAKHYLELLEKVKEKISSNAIDEKNIPEISLNAYCVDIDRTEENTNQSTMKKNKYRDYIRLLKANHNIVLTGAPGTGKTFLARKIAEEMGAVTEFVQFHPSYDYTDFVEGLRPINNGESTIGFERRDGLFKRFCIDAIENYEDSTKSKMELSWKKRLQHFIEDAIDQNKEFTLLNGAKFTIKDYQRRTIIVNNEQNEKTTHISVNGDDILELLSEKIQLNNVRDIRNYFNRKFGAQADSYAFILTKEIRNATEGEYKSISSENEDKKNVERKDYVFIIDEINRGEVSKIFGELFFLIDPGYRSTKENIQKVATQYQNLLPEGSKFSDGFYIPDNVYIIATMNDIDRSVESMDFAIRRRFTWVEVTPEKTMDMLDVLDNDIKEDAIGAMQDLNKEISHTEGLGKAYQVGPAYFLKLNNDYYGGSLEILWELNIEPLLREYLRGFGNAEDLLKKFEKAYFGND